MSWSLLRSADYPVVTTGGAVPPFFAGLLPEGVRLGVVTSSTKTSADDHLTLLLAIGADTVGNVRVVPAGAESARPLPMFEPERDTDFRAVFAKLTGSVVPTPWVGGRAAQGKCRNAIGAGPDPIRASDTQAQSRSVPANHRERALLHGHGSRMRVAGRTDIAAA